MKERYKDQELPGARSSKDSFVNSWTSNLTTAGGFISQIFKVPANYYLELRYGDEIVAVTTFPYDPENISYSRPTPVRLTYTLGGVVRETNTIRKHNISLSGRSGLAFRTHYTRTGALRYSEGEIVFQEFDEFLKRYIEICANEFGLPNNLTQSNEDLNNIDRIQSIGTHSKSLYLYLRCLKEDLHLKVEPINFTWNKNIETHRHDYAWTCDFIGYDYVKPYTNVFFDTLQSIDNAVAGVGGVIGLATNVFSNISNDYVGRIRKSLNNATGPMNALSEALTAGGNVANNTLGLVADAYDVVKSVGNVATAWDGFVDAWDITEWDDRVGQTTNQYFPSDNTQNSKQSMQIEGSNMALEALSGALIGVSERDDDEAGTVNIFLNNLKNNNELLRSTIPKIFFENRLGSKDDVNLFITLGEYLSNPNNLTLLSKFAYTPSSSDLSEYKENFKEHILQKGEDLINLAERYTGSANFYPILMKVNGWRDPRRDANGDYPKPGTKVLVPKSGREITNPFGNPLDPYGVDVSLNNSGDIDFEDNELILTKNIDNIKQHIRNKLIFRQGEVTGFNTFGLPELPTVSNTVFAAAVLRESLLGDKRIKDVTDLEISFIDDTLLIDCVIHTVGNGNFKIKTTI